MMTEPTQTELRTWARAQGIAVKDRGSLPLAVRQAYLEAHAAASPSELDELEEPEELEELPAAELEVPAADLPASAPAEDVAVPPLDVAGLSDLAGALRAYLASVEAEVTSVSFLSEQIDDRVTELNALRREQAVRLLALDELRESVTDPSLSAFLTKTIRPRLTRVTEIVPERLR